ncbi:MAG TPA: lytic transglycosylase domain-containing protein [Methylotenera sp.]|nr:lytic transglycosylase domain-containing protein [Methylotenera sp.]
MIPNTAWADIYIDLAKSDEISINNTQPNKQYTVILEEAIPTEPNTPILLNDMIGIHKLPYNREVVIAAHATDIEPALIHAVITVESKHNARALSKKGAYGLMQLMPATAKRFQVSYRDDPKQNILAGAKYLRELLDLFNGDLNLTLAAYNAGPGAVKKYHGRVPPYAETLNYVPKVLRYYRQYL